MSHFVLESALVMATAEFTHESLVDPNSLTPNQLATYFRPYLIAIVQLDIPARQASALFVKEVLDSNVGVHTLGQLLNTDARTVAAYAKHAELKTTPREKEIFRNAWQQAAALNPLPFTNSPAKRKAWSTNCRTPWYYNALKLQESGQTLKEIAKAFDKPKGTIVSAISRAKATIYGHPESRQEEILKIQTRDALIRRIREKHPCWTGKQIRQEAGVSSGVYKRTVRRLLSQGKTVPRTSQKISRHQS